MRAFVLVWFGQLVSLLGTAMTQFALTIWAYELTGQATALALVGFFNFAPTVIFSPIAGALVDRWNRKLVMMLSDLGAGAATIFIFLMYASGNLQMWHLYVAGFFTGLFQSFQFPAYSASISLMLRKEDYARAIGMMMLADSAPQIIAPVLAGFLLVAIGLSGIMLIDIITFVFALALLFIVFIPQPPRTAEGEKGRGSLLKESAYGFSYILARPSLLGLQLVFFSINFIGGITGVLMAPMILARSGQDEVLYGAVMSAFGVGGVVGALALSVWGGPKRRVHGVLLGMVASSLLGSAVMGLGVGLLFWLPGAFFMMFFIPLINGSNQAIWQAKVAPDVQGRVFAVRRLIAQITAPAAMLIAGPLADRLFEPALMPGGALAGSLGMFFGTGPGAGMAVLFVLTGLLGALVGFGGYVFPAVRNAEDLLPDHKADAQKPPAAAEGAAAAPQSVG
ncbi:MAG: MFS transporter [Chloroflexi bacterium]|nr:MFS transporter [Chloroflexota bacterium]